MTEEDEHDLTKQRLTVSWLGGVVGPSPEPAQSGLWEMGRGQWDRDQTTKNAANRLEILRNS